MLLRNRCAGTVSIPLFLSHLSNESPKGSFHLKALADVENFTETQVDRSGTANGRMASHKLLRIVVSSEPVSKATRSSGTIPKRMEKILSGTGCALLFRNPL